MDVPFIKGGPIRGVQDYPLIGHTTTALVFRYSGTGQLRLALRPSDITKARAPGGDQKRTT